MVNAARLIGPSIGGILIAMFGEGTCFLVNALSYIAVLLSLLLMRIPRRENNGRARGSVLVELKEGFHYAYNFMPIRTILMLLAVISMVAGGGAIADAGFCQGHFSWGIKSSWVIDERLRFGGFRGGDLFS